MRTLIVDRFEGEFVICEDDDRRMFAIVKEEAPEGVREGDCLTIDDEGNIAIDEELTAKRREVANRRRK